MKTIPLAFTRSSIRPSRARAGWAGALLFAGLCLPACGDVADGLSASSIESALCRDARCDDSIASGSADDTHADHHTSADAGTDACRSDSECGAGFECEAEHGTGYCKPHGHDAPQSAPGADAGAPLSCSTSLDCAAGEECEHPGESGAGYCKPHGGEHPIPAGDACYDDSDCNTGTRCESIGHGQRACAPGADDDGANHGDDYEGRDDRSGSNSGRH